MLCICGYRGACTAAHEPRRVHRGAYTAAREPRRFYRGARTAARALRRLYRGAYTAARAPRCGTCAARNAPQCINFAANTRRSPLSTLPLSPLHIEPSIGRRVLITSNGGRRG